MIIGISGSARSGKDLLFNLLSNNSIKGYKLIKLAFADELKMDLRNILKERFNIDVFNPSAEEKEMIRPLLVSYGTHLARKIDENYWVKKIDEKINSIEKNEKTLIFITDVRYPNEQNYIKTKFHKSLNVHLTRDGIGPANEEELSNNELLKSNSDIKIKWSNYRDNIIENDYIVDELLKKIYHYNEK